MSEQKKSLEKAKSGLEKAIGGIDSIPYDQPKDVEDAIHKAYNKLDKAYRKVIAKLNQ